MQTEAQAEASKYNWVLKSSAGFRGTIKVATAELPELRAETDALLLALDKLIAKVQEHNAKCPYARGHRPSRVRTHKIFVR